MIRSSVFVFALAAALTVSAQPSVPPAAPSPEPAPGDRYAQFLVDSIVALVEGAEQKAA